MELALQVILGVVTLLCFTIGANLFIKGAMPFLPKSTPPQPKLDNAFRFLSGMFFSFGFLLIWIIIHIETTTDFIYLVGLVVISAGLGRLYSRIKIGSAGSYYDFVMLAEISIGISIALLQYFR